MAPLLLLLAMTSCLAAMVCDQPRRSLMRGIGLVCNEHAKLVASATLRCPWLSSVFCSLFSELVRFCTVSHAVLRASSDSLARRSCEASSGGAAATASLHRTQLNQTQLCRTQWSTTQPHRAQLECVKTPIGVSARTDHTDRVWIDGWYLTQFSRHWQEERTDRSHGIGAAMTPDYLVRVRNAITSWRAVRTSMLSIRATYRYMLNLQAARRTARAAWLIGCAA